MANIHDAARAGDVVAVLSFLDADSLSLNARDRHSRTPLHLASWAGNADVVHTLCKKHADVGAAAGDNMAAIHFASQKGHIQVVRYLLAAGASVSACTRKGMSPLHYAIQGGHLDVAELLIKKGAKLDSHNKAGKKAIDLTADEEFRSKLLAAETESKEAKAADKKSKMERENATEGDSARLERGGLTSSPPKKKSKVDLSHLGMDQDLQDEKSSSLIVKEDKEADVS